MIVDTHSVNQLPILTIDPEFKALIPPLLQEERSGLESMIVAEGCRDALITWNGVLIDGHNRYEICHNHGIPFRTEEKEFGSRDDVKIWIIQNQFSRRNLSIYTRSTLALLLESFLSAQAKQRQAHGLTAPGKTLPENSPEAIALVEPTDKEEFDKRIESAKRLNQDSWNRHIREQQNRRENETRTQLAKIAGVSENTITRVKKIEEKAPEEVKVKLSTGEMSINEAYKEIRKAEKEEQKQIAIESLNKEISEPNGLYHVLVVDPPWQYEKRSEDATHRGRCLYPTMTIQEIMDMEIPAEENAILWLWTTNAFLHEAYHIIEEWDFTPKTVLTWVKDRMGTGDWLRGKSEHCILAIRGKPVIDLTNQTTILNAPLREHSRKPDEFYDMVNDLCPGRKIDIFSREPRVGWDQWGCESDKF